VTIMAVQAGVVMHNGDAVPGHLSRLLRDRMESFAPDQLHEVRAPGALVLHGARSWAGRQESWREAPAKEGEYVAFFDGRLDNRDDLIMRYFGAQERRRAISDSEVIARAIATSGVRALVACLGDWSVALIRQRDRAVILASDGLGARPLYYAKTTFGVLWSTDLAAVTTAAGVGSSDLDPAFFAGFVAALPPPLSVPFKGVLAVRPGATLTIEVNGRKTEEIWWAPWQVPLREDTPEDSALELLALWKRVVDDRIPKTVPALFELSGGFDSSSIVSMAANLRAREADCSALHTVTRLFPNEPAFNDIRFVRAVLDQCNCEPHFLDLSVLPSGRDVSAPVPDGPHGLDLATEALMRTIGARTLVSGRKGDLLMQAPTLNTSVVTASICAGRLRDVLRDATSVARATRLSAWRVLRDACQPFGRGFSGRFPVLLDRRRRDLAAMPEDLVRPELARDVREQWAGIYRSCRSSAPARRGLVCELARLTHRRRLEPPPNQAHLFHAQPFLDRRLVSFVLERQPRVIANAGQSRELMKKSFGCLLPSDILARRSKGYIAPIVRQTFLQTAELLWRTDRWALAELGVIQLDATRSGLRRFLDDPTMNPGGLLTLASAEFWLRPVLFGEAPSVYTIDRAAATEFTMKALRRGEALLQEEATTV
jgi:asparagine synthase (glutamine-hydrolysing)